MHLFFYFSSNFFLFFFYFCKMSLSPKMSPFFCHLCHLFKTLDFTGFKCILSPLSPNLTKFFIGGLSWYKPQLFVLASLSSTNSPRPQNIEGASSPSERLGEHERLRLSHSPLIGCLLGSCHSVKGCLASSKRNVP